MTAVSRGAVWWGPSLFEHGDIYRPWLVISDDSHPFSEEECLAVGLTTTPHEAGILVEPDHWIDGGTPRRSFVSPWYCTTLKHADVDRRQGELGQELVERVVHRLAGYIGAAASP